MVVPRQTKRRFSSRPRSSIPTHRPIFRYEWIDGVESLENYRPGGYHPVTIGDVIRNRYKIVNKLGFGSYSTTWLARDDQRGTYVSLKISTADLIAPEAAILQDISKPLSRGCSGEDLKEIPIPVILDQFSIEGPNGTHQAYTTTPAQSSISDACDSTLFRLETARTVAAELVSAVQFVHSRGYVHGDIHLGNVLIRLPSSFDNYTPDQLSQQFGQPQTAPVIRLDGQPRIRDKMATMDDEEKEAFTNLLRQMLAFNPADRLTAGEVLESEWMIRWARPQLEEWTKAVS